MAPRCRCRPRIVAPHPEGLAVVRLYVRPTRRGARVRSGLFVDVARSSVLHLLHERAPSATPSNMGTTQHRSASSTKAPLVAYVRVSTREQHRSGLGLEAQEEAIRRMAKEHGGKVLRVFVEQGSGADDDRPQLAEALAYAARRRAVLAVAKLDRLSRSVAKVAATLNSGVQVKVAACPDASKLELHLRATIAEEERRLISERTSEALKAASRRGTKLGYAQPGRIGGTTKDGRPVAETMAAGRRKAARNRSRAAATIRAALLAEVSEVVARHPDASLRQLARALEEAEVPTPRGNLNWNPTGVARLLAHLEAS